MFCKRRLQEDFLGYGRMNDRGQLAAIENGRGLTVPMKIIVFVEDFGATGVVRNAIAIATRLAEIGHEVTLLAAKPDGVLRETVAATVVTAALNEAERTAAARQSCAGRSDASAPF